MVDVAPEPDASNQTEADGKSAHMPSEVRASPLASLATVSRATAGSNAAVEPSASDTNDAAQLGPVIASAPNEQGNVEAVSVTSVERPHEPQIAAVLQQPEVCPKEANALSEQCSATIDEAQPRSGAGDADRCGELSPGSESDGSSNDEHEDEEEEEEDPWSAAWTSKDQEDWQLDDNRDYYAALKIPRDGKVTIHRVLGAYHRYAPRVHPHNVQAARGFPKDPEQAASVRRHALKTFWLITEAYLVLKDDERRRIYTECGMKGLRASEACYEHPVFEQDPFHIYDHFYGGEDEVIRDFLLMNGRPDPNGSSDEDDDENRGNVKWHRASVQSAEAEPSAEATEALVPSAEAADSESDGSPEECANSAPNPPQAATVAESPKIPVKESGDERQARRWRFWTGVMGVKSKKQRLQ